MTIEDLKRQYAYLIDEERKIKKDKKYVIAQAKELGYFFKNGRFKKDKTTYVLEYDFSYYSHFDGHLSDAIVFDDKGKLEVSNEDFQKLYTILKDKTGEDLDFFDFGTEYVEYADFIEKYFTTVSEDEIVWTYKGKQDQGELCDNSTFIIKKIMQSEL